MNELITDETECDKLAVYLETVANRLIEEKGRDQFFGMMIPIVRQVYDLVPPDKFPLVDWLYGLVITEIYLKK